MTEVVLLQYLICGVVYCGKGGIGYCADQVCIIVGKNKKMSINRHLLASFVSAEREGLATAQTRSAPLNAFPLPRRQAPCINYTAQGVATQPLLFSPHYSYKQACFIVGKNKKMSINRHLLASFVSAEREGFEPPVQLPVHRISSAARSTTPAPFL